jgi:hypothetical protein
VFALLTATRATVHQLRVLVRAGCPVDVGAVGMASAWSGRVDVLRLLVSLGVGQIGTRAWRVAAARGHLEWIYKAKRLNRAYPSDVCARAAAFGGRPEVLAHVQWDCDRADPYIVFFYYLFFHLFSFC